MLILAKRPLAVTIRSAPACASTTVQPFRPVCTSKACNQSEGEAVPQHAVTFAAGLACEGMIPFTAIYSSFLQRGYDQIVHDVCLQSLPGTFSTSQTNRMYSSHRSPSAHARDLCLQSCSVWPVAHCRSCVVKRCSCSLEAAATTRCDLHFT